MNRRTFMQATAALTGGGLVPIAESRDYWNPPYWFVATVRSPALDQIVRPVWDKHAVIEITPDDPVLFQHAQIIVNRNPDLVAMWWRPLWLGWFRVKAGETIAFLPPSEHGRWDDRWVMAAAMHTGVPA